jgi:dTDP-4-dehydrorhamnose reductase
MKIALLGSTGMLGSKLAEVLRSRRHEVLAPSRAQADLARPHTLETFFRDNPFDALVNCAAFTRVDACEESAKFSMVMTVNGAAVGWLAKFCRASGRKLVHFSTDYVFDGLSGEPYREGDATAPLNVYGRSKRQGEKLLLAESFPYYLIRTSWLFGPNGNNFVRTMADLLISKPRVEVVDDQLGVPTYTRDLAEFTCDLLERGAEPGTYHFCNDGQASWYDFAVEIRKRTGFSSCAVVPVSSSNVFRPAARPADSRLDNRKAAAAWGRPIPGWKDALGDYLEKEFQNAPA